MVRLAQTLSRTNYASLVGPIALATLDSERLRGGPQDCRFTQTNSLADANVLRSLRLTAYFHADFKPP